MSNRGMDAEQQRPAVIPAVSCAITCRGSILLLRRAFPPEAGRWAFPAGYVKPDESAEQAIEREVHEETGLTVTARYERSFPRRIEGRPYLSLCFTATTDQRQVTTNDESLDWRWVPLRDADLEQIDWAFRSHRTIAFELASSQ